MGEFDLRVRLAVGEVAQFHPLAWRSGEVGELLQPLLLTRPARTRKIERAHCGLGTRKLICRCTAVKDISDGHAHPCQDTNDQGHQSVNDLHGQNRSISNGQCPLSH